MESTWSQPGVNMLRSLLSLLLIAGINTAPMPSTVQVDQFDMETLLDVQAIPLQKSTSVPIQIGAEAALLMDSDTGIVLYEKNGYKSLPMASLTKIMTAILIMESHELNEVVTVTSNYSQMTEDQLGVRIWLRQYEKITVENLLIALLVPSAGDAALALANHHSGSADAFVKEMNKKAKILNLQYTNFTNPIGLDHKDHYASAYDLAILTKYALHNADFRRIVLMPNATITSTDGNITHQFAGTNYLLYNNNGLDIRGVKTGTTLMAGQCLINLVRDANGKEVIVVLLDSPERFTESKQLIEWVFKNYLW